MKASEGARPKEARLLEARDILMKVEEDLLPAVKMNFENSQQVQGVVDKMVEAVAGMKSDPPDSKGIKIDHARLFNLENPGYLLDPLPERIQQAAEINFDLAAAAPASGAVRKLCQQVIRQMMKAANGGWIPGRTYVHALCGDAFWDDLTANAEVRQTYLSTQEAKELRGGLAYESFSYGGIVWENYRGTDDGSTVAINADKAKFFPVNSNAFEVAWSPAKTFDYVNTPGQPVYGMVLPDDKRNSFVDLEVYSYPLFMCVRPAMLQRAKRTA